ncbi:MAG: hypothetical protein IT165_13810 [Bryobacterales bacterium]|nr:hypothetical protein [Bryobacterales bacterium]
MNCSRKGSPPPEKLKNPLDVLFQDYDRSPLFQMRMKDAGEKSGTNRMNRPGFVWNIWASL